MQTKYFQSLEKFKANLDPEITKELKWLDTHLQSYPLEILCKYLRTPTPLIKSNYHYLIHLEEGSYVQLIDNNRIEVKAPAIMLILKDTIHSCLSIEPDCKGYFTLIENRTLHALFQNDEILSLYTIDNAIALTNKDNEWFGLINKLLYDELLSTKQSRKILHGLLQAFLYRALKLSFGTEIKSRQHQIALAFKQLVYKHYVEHKNVSFYADQLGVSENYLNRCSKNLFNKSSKEIITEVNIINSQVLLLDTKKDISEVAFELNYEDPAYFARIFKKITSLTPTQYRAKVLHDLSWHQ